MQKTPISRHSYEMVCAARNVLEREYYRHYTLEELAEMLGTNDQKLKACFKEVTGRTLYEYLTMVRIKKAKELLEGSRLPLRVIAKKLGLDKSNLIKSFKKMTGVTPIEWRRGGGDKIGDNEIAITELPIFSPDSLMMRC